MGPLQRRRLCRLAARPRAGKTRGGGDAQGHGLKNVRLPRPIRIKLPPVDTLVMGTTLSVIREEGAFAVTPPNWYLPRAHVGGLGEMATDFVAVAERFVGTPYLWGGKSSLGIDCWTWSRFR